MRLGQEQWHPGTLEGPLGNDLVQELVLHVVEQL
jgi:hypothetical protein